ncbi:MAG: radical SAM protein [Desulfobacteraceae bacterium]|nr:radical SAM protein [Desulfobacteraceae bacterium]
MRILFCIYQLDYADHIALAYLSAIAKQKGHATFLCCMQDRELSAAIAEYQPDIVAYSANVYGFEQMVAAHKKAKANHRFISIMGGPHPTYVPETFAQAEVDAYCVGEGELAFGDFLDCIEKGQPFDGVPNLITAKGANPVRPLIRDLDTLPFPDRDLTLANSFLKNTPKKTFYATRGCPYRCKYCCNNAYHALYRGKGPAVRRFSVERIIREIEYVKSRYRTEFIKFGDDIFAIKADEWLKEFSDQYVRRIGIPFNCYLRIDRVKPEVLQLLKSAGCYSVHLSIDSTSSLVREKILGRQMKEIDLIAPLKLIRSYGINTWVNFMLAAPESTLQDDLNTIRVAREGRVTYAAYSTTVPMKGTELYDYSVAHRLIDPVTHKGDMTGCTQPTALQGFTEREKNIRYNVYLLGAIIAKLPPIFHEIAMGLIRIIPPNRLFKKMRDAFYKYSIENTIFRLHRPVECKASSPLATSTYCENKAS